MATFRFAVDKRSTRSKQFNIYLYVTVAGKTNKKKTGVVIDHVDDFNYKARQNNWIKTKDINAKSKNEQLRLIIEEARETFNKLEREGEVTSTGLLHNLKKETVSPSFFQFAKDRAKAIEEEGGWRNAKKYNNLINKLNEFKNKQRMSDIKMEDLTVELLEKFKNFLHKWKNQRNKDKLLHPNSIAVQFTIFKALVNQAVKMDLLPADKSPFHKFSYKGIPTQKEKLDLDELKRIKDLDIPEGSLIWNVRNCFLFSFYCAGIRAGDLLQLRWSNITEDGRLNYTMDKNDKPSLSSKEMSDMVFEAFIFGKKRGQKEFNGKLKDEDLKYFCVLENSAKDTLDLAISRYKLSQRAINKTLKVARSCADFAKSENIEKAHILEALSFRIKNESL